MVAPVVIALLVAVVVGFIVWIICRAVPFLARYSDTIAVIVTILVFLVRIGAL